MHVHVHHSIDGCSSKINRYSKVMDIEYNTCDEIDEMVIRIRQYIDDGIIINTSDVISQECGEAANLIPLEMYAPAHRSRSWVQCAVKLVGSHGFRYHLLNSLLFYCNIFIAYDNN